MITSIPIRFRPSRTAVALAILFSTTSFLAKAQQLVPDNVVPQRQNAAGTLTCDISAGLGLIVGSSRTMVCTFVPTNGRPELYDGTIRRFGLDLGVTAGTQLVWAVLSSGEARQVGSLSGEYVGGSVDASLGLGAGANLLVGGSNRGIALQPLSVQAQAGVNVAAGVSQLLLSFDR
jgi:hypothetical protein